MLPGVRTPWVSGFKDNECAMQLSEKPVTNSSSKHIEVFIGHHFLSDLVAKRAISTSHVRSSFQLVDVVKKLLSTKACQFHCNFVSNTGLVSCCCRRKVGVGFRCIEMDSCR